VQFNEGEEEKTSTTVKGQKQLLSKLSESMIKEALEQVSNI